MELPYIKIEEEHLCRLCGKMQGDVRPLCGEGSEDFVTLITRTLRYLNIEFIDHDMLPKWLCSTCHHNAKSTDQFLLMVEEGQRNLLEQIQEDTEMNAYETTAVSEDKPIIKLEIDSLHSAENSSENGLSHKTFEIKVNDPDTTRIEIEDSTLNAFTLVENKLQSDVNLYAADDAQQEHCASDRDTDLCQNIASDSDTGFYECLKCSATYEDEDLFTAHMANHALVLNLQCNKCNKEFAHNLDWLLHMCTYTEDESLVPEHCPETSASCSNSCPSPLKTGEQTSTSNLPYSCSICSKAFAHKSRLKMHLTKMHPNYTKRRSTTPKPTVPESLFKFECAECLKRFETQDGLNRHSLVHTGEKSYSCSLCICTFTRKANLEAHQALKHKDNTEKTASSEFFCISNWDFLQPE